MSFRRPRAVLEGRLPNPAPGRMSPVVAVASPALPFNNPVNNPAPLPSDAVIPARSTVREGDQPLIRIGSVLMSFFLFIYFSRLLDITSRVTLPFHIPMVLMSILLVLAISSGGIWLLISSKIANLEIMFLIWVGIATIFSSWKSGSIIIFQNCLYSVMVFFVILTLVRNMAQFTRVAHAMALAGLVAAIFGFLFSYDMRGGRVAVDIGSLADPNEYALILLMTLPYWWLTARNSAKPKMLGICAVLAGIPMLVSFFRTGSRAGLLTLGGLVVAVFFQSRAAQRVALAFGTIVLAVVAMVALPNNLKDRYFTYFSSDDRSLGADIDSAMGRRYLLMQSLKLTAEHPIFGVGPGQFGGVNWEISRANGINSSALVTHNTYTEVSSETGIPGLLLFAGTLILCLRSSSQISKLAANQENLKPIANAATCVLVSIVAFLIGAFFLSLAYTPLVTVALGLSAALRNIAVDDFGLVLERRG